MKDSEIRELITQTVQAELAKLARPLTVTEVQALIDASCVSLAGALEQTIDHAFAVFPRVYGLTPVKAPTPGNSSQIGEPPLNVIGGGAPPALKPMARIEAGVLTQRTELSPAALNEIGNPLGAVGGEGPFAGIGPARVEAGRLVIG